MNLTVDIQNASEDDEQPPPEDIKSWLDCAIHSAANNMADAELSIRIVDKAEIIELNTTYRHKNTSTNVLSFPADLPEAVKLPLLGDIIICAPVIRDEAMEQHKTLRAHWAHMIIHGSLHLLGYDHIDDDEARAMESMEINILEQLNFPNPYVMNLQNSIEGKHSKP